MNLFPMFLKLAGRRCLVVGAGPVGQSKIESLLLAGADVRVVAPRATRAVRAWACAGKVCWEARGFIESPAYVHSELRLGEPASNADVGLDAATEKLMVAEKRSAGWMAGLFFFSCCGTVVTRVTFSRSNRAFLPEAYSRALHRRHHARCICRGA